MLTLNANLAANLAGETPTPTLVWEVRSVTGQVLRGTTHDVDITIAAGRYAGTYPASEGITGSDTEDKADGSVKNAEVEGLLAEAPMVGIRAEEIEAGVWDAASAALVLVNWRAPDDGYKELIVGTLGEFFVDDNGLYRSEVRGVTQALAQNVTRSASERCDVKRFGDDRCRKNVTPLIRTATVTAVEHRKRFTAALDAGIAPLNDIYYVHGEVRWTGGDNSGYLATVRAHSPIDSADLIDLLLWDESVADIEVGDTLRLRPGCDRAAGTCRWVHNNFVNFRGVGVYSPGTDRMVQGPLAADADVVLLISEADYADQVAAAEAEIQALL